MKPIFCAFSFLMISSSAFASEKSDRLVEALKAKEQFEVQIERCINISKTVLTEKFFQDNPETFYGFTPQSKEWPEVLKLYDEFMDVSCHMLTSDEYITLVSKGLDDKLNDDELDDALEFFVSPSGQKLAAAFLHNSKITADFAYSDQLSEKIKAAKLKYHNDLEKLAKDAGLIKK